MRSSITSLFFLILLVTHAEDFTVFERDGFFGIKNIAGEVIVPATYQQLGWSDGTSQILNEVIGYKEGNFWGLISTKNKVLTLPKYYSVQLFQEGLIKVSLKGKFSNKLFYGLLNSSGKTEVSCNYFTLEPIGPYLMVSEYDGQLKYGMITYSNEVLIRCDYQKITSERRLYTALNLFNEIDLFDGSGQRVCSGIDSLIHRNGNYLAYKNGFAGLIDENGKIREEFLYKGIDMTDQAIIPIPFPKWSVYAQDAFQYDVMADSIKFLENGLLISFVNGANHFSSTYDTLLNLSEDHILMDVTENHFILRNTKSLKWRVVNKENEVILDDYDSIFNSQYSLWTLKDDSWTLFNRYGGKKNRFSFDQVRTGNHHQFLVKLNGHWGILNTIGEAITPLKYDHILAEKGYYKVKYLNKWGLMDEKGHWLLKPEYSETFVFQNFFVGQKGFSYAYFDKAGLIRKTTARPVKPLGNGLLVEQDSLLGIMDQHGDFLIPPEYAQIEKMVSYFVLKNSEGITVVDEEGNYVLTPDLSFQEVRGISEDYFLIKKNNRWGFVDLQGRLRISNRYDSARVFNEGFAPVMMRGKWGFIDKNENLTTQPYYDHVSPYVHGISLVNDGFDYGLIDRNGEEVIRVKWKSLKRLATGNYLFQNEFDKVGLIGHTGELLLNASFDSIIDYGTKVVVSDNGNKGVLDYSGNQLFRIGYKEIRISNDYTILKH